MDAGPMDAVERFAELVRSADLTLDRGALAIAAGADPAQDTDRWLAALDRLAVGVASLDGLKQRLFVEAGFIGNTEDYYDARNSLIPHVLVRRLGIPITLAVVTMEVGRRAGIELEGVGMPGHFLVRPPGTLEHIDVFDGGAELDIAACEARFRAASGVGRDVAFGPHLLVATPPLAMLARMLENLRAIYRARAQPADLEWVLRMRRELPGAGHPELLELAGALGDQAHWLEGAQLLDEAAEHADPVHAPHLRTAARALRAHLN